MSDNENIPNPIWINTDSAEIVSVGVTKNLPRDQKPDDLDTLNLIVAGSNGDRPESAERINFFGLPV